MFNKLFILNVITVNDNRIINDLVNSGMAECDEYTLKIFIRWVQIMFSTNDITNSWHGIYNQKSVPESVYMYLVSEKKSL
jgi:gliding motility-associated-like protein